MDYRDSIDTMIRYRKEVKKWNRKKFAKKVGVSSGYMGKIERGESNASFGIVCCMARVLGIDLGFSVTVEDVLNNVETKKKK